RVFESWQRARAIIDGQRDFYRVREDIELQRKRWIDGGRSRGLLIPPGKPLAEAEDVINKYGDELPSDVHAFVRSSGRRARTRQTLLGLATAAFALVAAFATLSSIEAKRQQTVAEAATLRAAANYQTARGTVDSLIGIIAGGLRDLKGVSVQTIDAALARIREIVDELGADAAKNDPTFDGTRAAMLYEFARTYQLSDPRKALGVAEDSLKYRRQLAAQFPGEPR